MKALFCMFCFLLLSYGNGWSDEWNAKSAYRATFSNIFLYLLYNHYIYSTYVSRMLCTLWNATNAKIWSKNTFASALGGEKRPKPRTNCRSGLGHVREIAGEPSWWGWGGGGRGEEFARGRIRHVSSFIRSYKNIPWQGGVHENWMFVVIGCIKNKIASFSMKGLFSVKPTSASGRNWERYWLYPVTILKWVAPGPYSRWVKGVAWLSPDSAHQQMI